MGAGIVLSGTGLGEEARGTAWRLDRGAKRRPRQGLRVRRALAYNNPPPVSKPIDELGQNVPSKRVLVVDDNPDAAAMLGQLLELQGHEVHTAHDGLEAVAAASELEPDVVLLDVGLPKLNGYDAARKIRQQAKRRELLLVAVTGWGQEEDRRRSREAGFDAHLVKPVDLTALNDLLRGD